MLFKVSKYGLPFFWMTGICWSNDVQDLVFLLEVPCKVSWHVCELEKLYLLINCSYFQMIDLHHTDSHLIFEKEVNFGIFFHHQLVQANQLLYLWILSHKLQLPWFFKRNSNHEFGLEEAVHSSNSTCAYYRRIWKVQMYLQNYWVPMVIIEIRVTIFLFLSQFNFQMTPINRSNNIWEKVSARIVMIICVNVKICQIS